MNPLTYYYGGNTLLIGGDTPALDCPGCGFDIAFCRCDQDEGDDEEETD